MIDINEKISALYDGELKDSEIDDLIKIINEDKKCEIPFFEIGGLLFPDCNIDFISEAKIILFSSL